MNTQRERHLTGSWVIPHVQDIINQRDELASALRRALQHEEARTTGDMSVPPWVYAARLALAKAEGK